MKLAVVIMIIALPAVSQAKDVVNEWGTITQTTGRDGRPLRVGEYIMTMVRNNAWNDVHRVDSIHYDPATQATTVKLENNEARSADTVSSARLDFDSNEEFLVREVRSNRSEAPKLVISRI